MDVAAASLSNAANVAYVDSFVSPENPDNIRREALNMLIISMMPQLQVAIDFGIDFGIDIGNGLDVHRGDIGLLDVTRMLGDYLSNMDPVIRSRGNSNSNNNNNNNNSSNNLSRSAIRVATTSTTDPEWYWCWSM
jgi:hypothetical protein